MMVTASALIRVVGPRAVAGMVFSTALQTIFDTFPQFALYSHSARIWLLVQMRSPPNRSGGAGVRGERGESRLFLVESRRKVPEPRSLAHAAAPGESGAMCATSLILGAGANAAAYVLNTAPRVAHP